MNTLKNKTLKQPCNINNWELCIWIVNLKQFLLQQLIKLNSFHMLSMVCTQFLKCKLKFSPCVSQLCRSYALNPNFEIMPPNRSHSPIFQRQLFVNLFLPKIQVFLKIQANYWSSSFIVLDNIGSTFFKTTFSRTGDLKTDIYNENSTYIFL